MQYSEVDIQLILEFKNSFVKYHPVFHEIVKGFFGTPCIPGNLKGLYDLVLKRSELANNVN